MVIDRSLGFSAGELVRLEIAALLHDVGKIGIDDRILRKPTNLTPDEFEIMKTHPDKGAAILAQIEQLRDIIPGMRAHHENYDGSGYPQGLKGEEIPILGRVITVADTFDAMTTDRPYQKAFTLEFALNRIRTMANIKYDPKIVEAFGRSCEEGKVTLHKPSRTRPRQPVASNHLASLIRNLVYFSAMKRVFYLLFILTLAIASCSNKKQVTQPKTPDNPVAELKQADQLLIHKRCPEAITAYHKFLEKY